MDFLRQGLCMIDALIMGMFVNSTEWKHIDFVLYTYLHETLRPTLNLVNPRFK